ncbi:transcriptional regulator [Mycobacterium tuberculosis]|nr:transcriptional regulator [Mycobacterium tuberculosis]
MAQAHSAPLTGYRIAVTSARRAEELCALLRRQGAEVCSAPAIKMIALPDDDELQNNTEALIADPPDILVAHTGIGFRGWLAAAEGWGLGQRAPGIVVVGPDHLPRTKGNWCAACRRPA